MLWRSLALASVALLAGCTTGTAAPVTAPVTHPVAAPVDVATTAVASGPAHGPPCSSNADCGAHPTGGLCVPMTATREVSDAEDFLVGAMTLQHLVTRLGDRSSSSPIATVVQQVQDDLSTYSRFARGDGPPDAGAPPTATQRQDAAWMQSGAAQAMILIRQFWGGLSTAPITTDAQKLDADITGDGTGPHLDSLVGDLQTFLQDLQVVLAPVDRLVAVREPDGGVPGLRTGAGALAHYLGPVLANIHDATSGVRASLDPSATARLRNELTLLSQALDRVGKDGTPGACLEAP